VGARHRLGDGLGEGQLAFLGQAAGKHLLIGAARALHHLVDLARGLRIGIVDRNVDAVQQQARDPARANDSAADGGCFLDSAHADAPALWLAVWGLTSATRSPTRMTAGS